jgi:lipopolysaccharide/colanic/teichoic acid biosynthesis glycosyltransferase
MKRAFDIIVSGFALLVLSPFLLSLIIVLRLTGEGEVFYRQKRVGRAKRIFSIYKFATMLKNSPNLSGGDITIANDPRILRLGHFLRNTKINELPQLLNVLFGDMSVIGWRPTTPRLADLYPDNHWNALKDWRPGLSGIGSIVFRDEEKLLSHVADRLGIYQKVIVPYKSELELWYVSHQNFWLDMKLIYITALAIVNSSIDVNQYIAGLPPEPAEMLALRKGRE